MGAVPKIAVIGLGIWGKNHALAYAHYHGCELALVCDADPARARATGENLGVDDGHISQSGSVRSRRVSIATPTIFTQRSAGNAPGRQERLRGEAAGDQPG